MLPKWLVFNGRETWVGVPSVFEEMVRSHFVRFFCSSDEGRFGVICALCALQKKSENCFKLITPSVAKRGRLLLAVKRDLGTRQKDQTRQKGQTRHKGQASFWTSLVCRVAAKKNLSRGLGQFLISMFPTRTVDHGKCKLNESVLPRARVLG